MDVKCECECCSYVCKPGMALLIRELLSGVLPSLDCSSLLNVFFGIVSEIALSGLLLRDLFSKHATVSAFKQKSSMPGEAFFFSF